MARAKITATCQGCGHEEPRWLGRCPACGAWGSMHEAVARAASGASPGAGRRRARPVTTAAPAVPVSAVASGDDDRTPTGVPELDRVLGGGLVAGSITLLGGEPGAGKSTLLLQAANALAERGSAVLYVSAEESAGQLRLRADRLSALCDRLLVAARADLDEVLGLVEHHAPDVLVVDSVQTVRAPDVGGAAGGVAQVRACAEALVAAAKARGMAVLLVGHVTKEGGLAGPKVLEHVVDTVLELEADRSHSLRLVRATKHRFGAVGQVGCFEMTSSGLTSVADAGRLFVGDTPASVSGVAVTVICEGPRPLACEVQALVVTSCLSTPRRVASGVDSQRLGLLLAVLERRGGVSTDRHDVYASTVGGARLSEPGVDLALAIAVASSRRDTAVTTGLVVIGEVGLAGEIRAVANTERRLAEAARLGFRSAVVPAAYDGDVHGLRVWPTHDLRNALSLALAGPAAPPRPLASVPRLHDVTARPRGRGTSRRRR